MWTDYAQSLCIHVVADPALGVWMLFKIGLHESLSIRSRIEPRLKLATSISPRSAVVQTLAGLGVRKQE
jgi:hypothetical protein